ncbi:MAG TPA: precorrin-8X methylmutase [Rhodospirillaceae bacterium]|nr:precorrin-8X methylmutase [Rhodospirillaceae bacterium]HAT34395.1 precorrin-8X methylmutase [Rhodospirillaceae bacterium]
MDYIRDPDEIYRRSFEIVAAETDISGLPSDAASIAHRIVHACGMPDIVADLKISAGAVEAAKAALSAGKPILADCTMVSSGIIRQRLTNENEVICTLPATPSAESNTRSANAVDAWLPHLAGALVAIGNAPTALFRLLELIANDGPKPAVILGFPVGFVGAAESKSALAEGSHGVPFITLLGRRGGSAMAAAAVNALATESSK